MHLKKFIILGLLLPLANFAKSKDEAFFELQQAQKRIEAHTVKSEVADFDENTKVKNQPNNGDQERYSDLRGNFGKALLHFASGLIDPNAYNSLLKALQSGSNNLFNQIILGGATKLQNPQAALTYSLDTIDPWIRVIPSAPAFSSAETASEMVENYWTVLVRDVPFNQFDINGTVAMAVADLNTMTDFQGPKINGMVTPDTFLRGTSPGCLIGPFVSQFLYQNVPYANSTIDQTQYTVPTQTTMNDFLTTFNDWFTVINGGSTGKTITKDLTKHFMRTPRDLTYYVHQDSSTSASLNAAYILNGYLGTFGNAVLDPSNPYFSNPTQAGFVTFAFPYVLALVPIAVEEALKAVWYQKWVVHRRVRPEEFGFYLNEMVNAGQNFGINSQLINSTSLPQIQATYGSVFLPIAYPEGCPAHPSYPAGHAVQMGAAVTVLKAFYNENFVIQNPLQPNMANNALVPYVGTLTVGNELDKLAFNIALARDYAGVHYRSDGLQGILLGEQIAIDLLNNVSFLFNENFSGFSLTKFDGTTITVGGKR